MNRRRVLSLRSNREAANQDKPAYGYSKNIKLLPFLINEYGGFEFILDIADSFLNFVKRFYLKNKRYQSFVTTFKYLIPLVVFSSQFISKYKLYRKIKSGGISVFNECEEKILTLIGNKSKNVSTESSDFYIGIGVSRWLFQRPRTESFKIQGYYQYDNLQPIQDIYKEDDSTIFTVLEYNGKKLVWNLRVFQGPDGDLIIRESLIYHLSNSPINLVQFKATIYREFIKHFNTQDNILLLSSEGLQTFPRMEIFEESKQFDVQRLCNEIRKILKRKKKRGFVFVGVPGTGKSTIIHKLEMFIKEYPTVYLSSTCFIGAHAVKETFETIKYIQPCIAVIEDLDSCELKNKNQSLGEFLEQIDDIDNKLNVVFLVTVNDTALIHYSLINRPGRLDQVIKIKPPQDPEEVYGVMSCRFMKNKMTDPDIKGDFIPYDDIDKDLLKIIVDRQYTQADICEIIEKSLLMSNKIDNQLLRSSVCDLEESKKALRECNFGGDDPFASTSLKSDDII